VLDVYVCVLKKYYVYTVLAVKIREKNCV